MKSTFAIATGILTLLLIAAACEEGRPQPLPPAETPPPVTPLPPGVTPAPPNVCLPNPDPAAPAIQVIDAPQPGDAVTSPLQVRGQIIAFEATFQVTIFDAQGHPIVNAFGTAEAADVGVLAPFSLQVEFMVSEPTPACLWVYELSPRDGGVVNVGQVPILLLP